MLSPLSRRGFTLIELAAVLTVGSTAAMMCALSIPPAAPPGAPDARPPAKADPDNDALLRARASARLTREEWQLRNIYQSMIVFSQNNGDAFPLPSALDLSNDAVPEIGAAKDTTANILSILIFQGAITPELTVSPAEIHPRIKADEDFQYAEPPAAANPARAIWDPAFAADFTDGNTGNVSYAHLQPSAGRKSEWSNTSNPLQPIVGNRGPLIAAVTADERGLVTATPAHHDSNTLRIHGPANSWEGVMAYNDGAVRFIETYGPNMDPAAHEWPSYKTAAGKHTADTLFFDEPDDPKRSNTFLGIFTEAGPSPIDFRPIWD